MDLNETSNSHINFYPYNHNLNHQNPRHYAQPAQYKWQMSEWSDCNNVCDGEQFRTATCVQIETNRQVAPSNCRESKPDDEYQACNSGCYVEYVSQLVFILSKIFQYKLKFVFKDGKFNDQNAQWNAVMVFNN